MLCVKSLPFLLLLSSFPILSNFLLGSHAASDIQIRGIIDDVEYDVVSWGTKRRSVRDENNAELVENKSMILAAERTHRKDPLNNFKYYTGGWNIKEEHYFYSVAYTAAPLFLIAVIWFMGYAVTLLVICIRHCCCQFKHFGYSQTTYAISLTFLIFFTVAEIIGCIVLYTGQEKFHNSSTSTLKFVVNQADDTIVNLTTLSDYLSAAKGVGVDQISLPPPVQDSINNVNNMINSSATTLQKATDENSDKIQDVLRIIQVILITASAVMLFLAFLGFLLSIFGLQSLLYIMAVIGWILATIALILSCVSLILHNVVGDTCVAMDEWVQNPAAHTALDDILPCVDQATAQKTLSETKQVSFQLVNFVNSFITNVSNLNPPENLPPTAPRNGKLLYYNQSGPLVPVLCNPFNSDMTYRNCTTGEVHFTNASQVWSKYICQVSADGNCNTTGRLTPEFYKQMVYTVNVSYVLYHYGPFLVELVDCSFVRETFSGIVEHHCPGLNRYSEWVFIAFLMVSVATMVCLVLWVFYAKERRRRDYSKKLYKSIGEESNVQSQ